jgi:hypothetical protein
MIGRGNRSTRRKPAPMPLCPPQTPHAARTRSRAVAVGSQRLTSELRHGLPKRLLKIMLAFLRSEAPDTRLTARGKKTHGKYFQIGQQRKTTTKIQNQETATSVHKLTKSTAKVANECEIRKYIQEVITTKKVHKNYFITICIVNFKMNHQKQVQHEAFSTKFILEIRSTPAPLKIYT